MTVGRRGIVSILAVTVVGVALSTLLVALRFTSPFSGAVLDGSRAFVDGGVRVAILPGAVTALRSGDLVTAIRGRSIEEWAAAWASTNPRPGPA